MRALREIGDGQCRLLRALAVYGDIESAEGAGYRLTPVGERLLSDHPESVRDYLLFYFNPTRLAAVRHLPNIVAEGGPTGYELQFGKGMFEVFDEDPEFSEQFNGMQDLSRLGETKEIVETLDADDFTRFNSVCDVGGYGDLLIRLLDRYPHLEGTVHDWSVEAYVRILSNIDGAAPDDGLLFVRERIVSADEPAPETIDMDVWMMLETGGQERTRAEFDRLFAHPGWEIKEVLAVDQDLSIIRCAKR